MTDNIEQRIYDLIRPYAGTYLFNIRKMVLHPEDDLDSDLNIDELEVAELMAKFFKEFNVDKANFNLKTYFPDVAVSFNPFRKPVPVPVPFFTIQMLIDSARAGTWLFD